MPCSPTDAELEALSECYDAICRKGILNEYKDVTMERVWFELTKLARHGFERGECVPDANGWINIHELDQNIDNLWSGVLRNVIKKCPQFIDVSRKLLMLLSNNYLNEKPRMEIKGIPEYKGWFSFDNDPMRIRAVAGSSQRECQTALSQTLGRKVPDFVGLGDECYWHPKKRTFAVFHDSQERYAPGILKERGIYSALDLTGEGKNQVCMTSKLLE